MRCVTCESKRDDYLNTLVLRNCIICESDNEMCLDDIVCNTCTDNESVCRSCGTPIESIKHADSFKNAISTHLGYQSYK